MLRGMSIALACLVVACDGGGETDQGVGATSGGPRVILDGGGTIPDPPDGVAACPEGACNYQTGAGCTGASPACRPELVGGAAEPACEAAGDGGVDAPCTDSSACAAGYVCAAGACAKLCCGGDWSACGDADRHCIRSVAVGPPGSAVATGAMVCARVNDCDALDPTSCSAPGTACQIVDPTGATACFPEGTGGAGEPCPCKGGFVCVSHAGAPVCRKLCRAIEGGGEPSCEANAICVHYAKDPPGVGECVE